MPKLLAQDLGAVSWRTEGSGDPNHEWDGIPYHADRGCFVHPSCFTCPLPECRLVDPAPYEQFLKEQERKAILAAVLEEGLSIVEVAQRFRRSDRFVYRLLAEHRQCPRCGRMDNRLVYTKRTRGNTHRSFNCRNCQHRWKATEEETMIVS